MALVELLFAVTILSGIGLCGLGAYCYRRWDEQGVGPFAAFTALLGIAAIGGGVLGIVDGGAIPEEGPPRWADVGIFLWSVAMVPWALFALQYTGRFVRVRWRTVAAMILPILVILPLTWGPLSDWANGRIAFQIVGTLAILYFFCLMIVGCYLVLRTTHQYGHLSLAQGVSLAIGGTTTLVAVNSLSVLAQEASRMAIVATYVVAFAVPAVALGMAVFRYDMFEATPAVGAIGERAIARATDDLVFVVDHHGRIIKRNEAAAATLGLDGADVLGEPLADHLETDVDELADLETLSLGTERGRRRFDPQVSNLTDQHDRPLGFVVSLRDVTDRERRRQRLSVLNRVLRHNLRNQLDVIRANAEVVADEADDDHADAILASTDDLAALGRNARSIDRLLSRDPRSEPVDLVAAIDRALDATDAEDADVDVTVDAPASASLSTDPEAVETILESALENALAYADRSVRVTLEPHSDGYAIEIADDGPGIPEIELASLEAGTETAIEHGTGLGLWQLKWGVTTINGDLTVDTDDGTTVRVTVPDRDPAP